MCRIAVQISLAAFGEILRFLPLAFTPSPRLLVAEYPLFGNGNTLILPKKQKAKLLNFLRVTQITNREKRQVLTHIFYGIPSSDIAYAEAETYIDYASSYIIDKGVIAWEAVFMRLPLIEPHWRENTPLTWTEDKSFVTTLGVTLCLPYCVKELCRIFLACRDEGSNDCMIRCPGTSNCILCFWEKVVRQSSSLQV